MLENIIGLAGMVLVLFALGVELPWWGWAGVSLAYMNLGRVR